MKIACVLMAAGAARRFGGEKIFAFFEGERLYQRALRLAKEAGCFAQIALVCRAQDAARVTAPGARVLVNATGERSRTIRAGVQAFEAADGIVFMACDQPLLRADSLRRLADSLRAQETAIIALGAQGRPRSPVLFSRAFFAPLAALEGEAGGKQVIRAHAQALRVIDVSEEELRDADTPQALEALKRQTREKGVPPGQNA